MADKTLYARIKYLVQSASAWSTSNPTLLKGEVGFESDTGKSKIGDGTSAWNSLSYSKVSVVDNLTSTSTVDPLSANQGKVLKGLIDNAGTVKSITAGVGLSGGTITSTGTVKANLKSETSMGTIGTTDKLYAVGVDSNGNLATSVPWSDTHYTANPILGNSNSTTNATTTVTSPYLNIIENNAKSGGIQIVGSGGTTTSAINGILTINSTAYSTFVKSGSGAAGGLVPSPDTTAGSTKYLREDATWAVPPDTKVTSVSNHYSPTSDPNYRLDASGATGTSGSTIQVITGVTRDAAGHVTGIISGAATDTTYSSLPESSGGTSVSLVTTGEKYSWNERVTHDELYATVISAISYKGTVSTTTQLPVSGNTSGDVYYVTTPKTLYAWDGTSWQSWGSTTIVDATTTQRGVVKIGNGLTITSGTLSLTTTNLEALIGVNAATDRLVDFTAKTDNTAYDIALAANKTSGSGALGYGNTSNKKLTFNPSTGMLNSYNYSTNYGDLAEDIDCGFTPEPGYCYAFDGSVYYKTSSYADQQFIGIHSDTAGYILRHDTDDNKLRVALSGFVLAYVDKEYKPGTPLTCWKNGTLTEASDIIRSGCPDLVVAKYWKSEKSEMWNDVPVNGRHWVKVLH